MAKALLIDGSNLIHRAFYALPLLKTTRGEFSNAVYGLVVMLNKILDNISPDYVAVCFDKSRQTFRKEIAEDYKATRQATPPELKGQFETAKEVINALGLAWEELEGYEGDDLLGTLADSAEREGFDAYILSGDRDVLQLIGEHTSVYLTKKGIGETELWDRDKVWEHYNLKPAQLIDLKGLMGDASDNISGVPGVGEKTALKLLHQFGYIDNLLAALEEVPNQKLREKLAENKDKALLSRRLATICRDAPLQIDWDKYRRRRPGKELLPLYRRLEFKSLISTLLSAEREDPFAEDEAPWPAPQEEPLPNRENFQSSILSGLEDARKLAGDLKGTPSLAVYLEWRGAARNGEATLFGLALPSGQSWGMEIAGALEPDKLTPFAALLADEKTAKLCIEAKDTRLLLLSCGMELRGVREDAALAAYLLDPGKGAYDIANLAGPTSLQGAEKAAWYAFRLFALTERLSAEIAACGADMDKLYREVELPLADVLCRMEYHGVMVREEKLSEMSRQLETETFAVSKEIHALAGHEFNINSPKQLAEVLFTEMGLPPLKKTKTGYSTDAEVLEQLAEQHEIAKKIVDYRTYSKLKSTYAD
ncbi:MAG: DNA polymerase, partial [Clostridiales bacterium]|nr:DNA polymerase [Clostridiales bacterium]